ncbi:serine hydrolase domain-containing protein [Altererythrobacter sp. Z27]|uniref:serine hydrolase domain-containing protein n=1 Tax=Altererythrobacter sp. Z27 TaxID=3461147 RepID=UPI0040441A9A
MIRIALAALLVCMPAMASADDPPVPATVVVAFDSETIRPLIVEGVADRASGRQVEANDPVRIASISKLIMALATLRLVNDGKVSLDADVSDYLGWKLRSPHFPDAKVTLAQLLSHRSGLRDRVDYIIPLGESLRERVSDPDAWFADAPPGEAPFEYANLGSPVVATVLEAATGERYDRLVERTVFAPLGIEACLNWVGCSPERVQRAVVLYRDTGEVARDDAADLPPNCAIPVAEGVECSLDDYVPGTNASILSPQGGVRIGMMDLARIGQELMRERSQVFPNEMMLPAGEALFAEQSPGQDFFCRYGFHMQVIDESDSTCKDTLFGDGQARLGHAGEAYGLRAGLWFTMEGRQGVAYFTTAVPPRPSTEDEGGFDPREIELMARAQALLAANR